MALDVGSHIVRILYHFDLDEGSRTRVHSQIQKFNKELRTANKIPVSTGAVKGATVSSAGVASGANVVGAVHGEVSKSFKTFTGNLSNSFNEFNKNASIDFRNLSTEMQGMTKGFQDINRSLVRQLSQKSYIGDVSNSFKTFNTNIRKEFGLISKEMQGMRLALQSITSSFSQFSQKNIMGSLSNSLKTFNTNLRKEFGLITTEIQRMGKMFQDINRLLSGQISRLRSLKTVKEVSGAKGKVAPTIVPPSAVPTVVPPSVMPPSALMQPMKAKEGDLASVWRADNRRLRTNLTTMTTAIQKFIYELSASRRDFLRQGYTIKGRLGAERLLQQVSDYRTRMDRFSGGLTGKNLDVFRKTVAPDYRRMIGLADIMSNAIRNMGESPFTLKGAQDPRSLGFRIGALRDEFAYSSSKREKRYYDHRKRTRHLSQSQKLVDISLTQLAQSRSFIYDRINLAKALGLKRGTKERKELTNVLRIERKRLIEIRNQVKESQKLSESIGAYRGVGGVGGVGGKGSGFLGGFFTSPRLPFWSIIAFRIGGVLASFHLLSSTIRQFADKVRETIDYISEGEESLINYRRRFGDDAGTKRYSRVKRMGFGSVFEPRDLTAIDLIMARTFGKEAGIHTRILSGDQRNANIYDLVGALSVLQRTDPAGDKTPMADLFNLMTTGRSPRASTQVGAAWRIARRRTINQIGGGEQNFGRFAATQGGVKLLMRNLVEVLMEQGLISTKDRGQDAIKRYADESIGGLQAVMDNLRGSLRYVIYGQPSQAGTESGDELANIMEEEQMPTATTHLVTFYKKVIAFYKSILNSVEYMKGLISLFESLTGVFTDFAGLLGSVVVPIWQVIQPMVVALFNSMRLGLLYLRLWFEKTLRPGLDIFGFFTDMFFGEVNKELNRMIDDVNILIADTQLAWVLMKPRLIEFFNTLKDIKDNFWDYLLTFIDEKMFGGFFRNVGERASSENPTHKKNLIGSLSRRSLEGKEVFDERPPKYTSSVGNRGEVINPYVHMDQNVQAMSRSLINQEYRSNIQIQLMRENNSYLRRMSDNMRKTGFEIDRHKNTGGGMEDLNYYNNTGRKVKSIDPLTGEVTYW